MLLLFPTPKLLFCLVSPFKKKNKFLRSCISKIEQWPINKALFVCLKRELIILNKTSQNEREHYVIDYVIHFLEILLVTRPRQHCFPLRICFHRLPRFYGSQRDLLLGFRFLKKSSRSLLPRDSDVKLLLGFQKNLLIWVASNQIRLKWLAGARELDWNCIRRQIKKRELARYYF